MFILYYMCESQVPIIFVSSALLVCISLNESENDCYTFIVLSLFEKAQ